MPGFDVRALRIDGSEVHFWIQEVVQPGTGLFSRRGLLALNGRELSLLEEPPTWESIHAYADADLARLFAGEDASYEVVEEPEAEERRRPA